MSPPWMPFYVADYLADTRRLTTLEHGAYMLLIMEYWQHGGLPPSEHRLARIANLTDREWPAVRAAIRPYFDENWKHKRIEAELAKAVQKNERRVQAGKAGGYAKHRGKQSSSIASSNATLLPEQSPSNALASSTTIVGSNEPTDIGSLRDPLSSVADDDPPPANGPIRTKAVKREAADAELLLDLVDIWNAEATVIGLPIVRDVTGKRQSALRARIRDFPTYGFDDPRLGFRELMARIRGSPLLRGETGNWRANFDFAVRESSFHKTMEGAYEGSADNHRRH